MSAQEIPEPRNAGDVSRWMYESRQLDHQQARAEKRGTFFDECLERGKQLYLPFDPTIRASTAYQTIVKLTPDGTVGNKAQTSKPRPDKEKTEDGGGPYLLDLETGECNCICYAGRPAHIGPGGKLMPAKEANGFCKHSLGWNWWHANVPFTLRPVGTSGKSALVVWDIEAAKEILAHG